MMFNYDFANTWAILHLEKWAQDAIPKECTWSQPRINELVQKKGPSLLVGSYHNFGRQEIGTF